MASDSPQIFQVYALQNRGNGNHAVKDVNSMATRPYPTPFVDVKVTDDYVWNLWPTYFQQLEATLNHICFAMEESSHYPLPHDEYNMSGRSANGLGGPATGGPPRGSGGTTVSPSIVLESKLNINVLTAEKKGDGYAPHLELVTNVTDLSTLDVNDDKKIGWTIKTTKSGNDTYISLGLSGDGNEIMLGVENSSSDKVVLKRPNGADDKTCQWSLIELMGTI